MKLLHAADFHLDAPFAALSPEKAALRRAEGRQLLLRLAELAGTEQVDLVLLAGDLFDSKTVYRETLTALTEALAAIPAPVLIAPGNHDPFTSHGCYATLPWPENVTIFTSETVVSKPFPPLGCVVHGIGFCQERVEHNLLEGFSAPHDGLLHIGLVHGDIGPCSSPYNPMTPASIADSRLDYLALGHIHAPSGLQKTGATHWAYPGCPEGHGFDELGDHGCYLVTLEHGRVSADFRPLGKRRYLEVAVDVSASNPFTAAVQALATQSPEDCIKLLLTGECDAAPDLDALTRQLDGRVFALRIKDATRPRSDLWGRAKEDTLTGAFLRLLRERQAGGAEAADLAVRFGLAALERGEDCRP